MYIFKRSFQWLLSHKDDLISNFINETKVNPSEYGLIYGINKINSNQWYIGRTNNLFSRLWSQGIFSGYCNQIILNDEDSFIDDPSKFTFEILDKLRKTDYEYSELIYNLSKLEEQYIIKYDSVQSGYNKSYSGLYLDGKHLIGSHWYYHPETEDCIIVPKDKLPPEGYVRGRYSPTEGTIWIHNRITDEYRMVLPDNIPDGFIQEGIQGLHEGIEWYHNPNTNECIRLYPEDEIPTGFIKGRGRQSWMGKVWVYSYVWNDIMQYSWFELAIDIINGADHLKFGQPRGDKWNLVKYKNKSNIKLEEVLPHLNKEELSKVTQLLNK